MKPLAFILLTFLIFTPPAFSQSDFSQEIRYSLSPVVSGTAWNKNLGLNDGILYGGKLGIDFGQSINLEVCYLTSGNLWTRFSDIDLLDTSGVLVSDQRFKTKRIGGDLLIRWPSDRIAPFAKVGGGVIIFETDSGDKTEKIDVHIGGGLDYILSGRVRVRGAVEVNRFRLDRYSLAPGGATSGQYPLDPDADKIRNNLSVNLSLDYALGQSRFRAVKDGDRLHPFSAIELEPLFGRFDFDDPLIRITTAAGARVGGELNPWVGWGLFYWHAMESDLSDTRPLLSYGGEARFGLASKSGPQPFLTIGAGQLDFRSGFEDSEGNGREDKTALILGAGIRAEIVSAIRLSVGIRDYMYSQGRLDRVSGTEEISHNWLLSGSLVFGLGGRGGKPKDLPILPPASSLTIQTVPQAQDSEARSSISETSREAGQTASKLQMPDNSGTATSYVSEKSITIPVPLEGEVYIRYGRPSQEPKPSIVAKEVEAQIIVADSIGVDVVTDKSAIDSAGLAPAMPAVAPPANFDSLGTPTGQTTPISRYELDSLLNSLRSDISAMLASRVEPQPLSRPALDTIAAPPHQDSLVAALRAELIRTQEEKQRLDSLIRIRDEAAALEQDSLAQQKIQKAIADQVAAALAVKPEPTGESLTQADLNEMMAALTSHVDSLTSQRAAIDSARLRDQLQLEVIRQTRSQDEFQRALEDFMRRYQQPQTDKSNVPPAVIITQPAGPSPQIVDRTEPVTVVIKPDTQYVVMRDTMLDVPDTEISPGEATSSPAEEEGFSDLRPTLYTGFGLEKPKQFILGGRLDIGPITAKEERLRLVPEFALGLGGGGVSVMAVMNAEYHIVDISTGRYRLGPYLRLGVGVLGFGGDINERETDGVLNLTYGLSIDPGKTGWFRKIGDPALFVEHQIIDLFDFNRIILGLQWSR